MIVGTTITHPGSTAAYYSPSFPRRMVLQAPRQAERHNRSLQGSFEQAADANCLPGYFAISLMDSQQTPIFLRIV